MDNFSFVENSSQKHQSYQQEAESTLNICFFVLKIRKSDDFRELYENEPEMAAPRLETNIDICDVMFGELVFMTIRDSEAFEKSSSLFQGFLKFID